MTDPDCSRCDGAATCTAECCDYDECFECAGTAFKKDCGNCHDTGRNRVDVPCRSNPVRLFRAVSRVVCTPNVFYDSRPDPVDTEYELLGMLVCFDAEVESLKAGTLTSERL